MGPHVIEVFCYVIGENVTSLVLVAGDAVERVVEEFVRETCCGEGSIQSNGLLRRPMCRRWRTSQALQRRGPAGRSNSCRRWIRTTCLRTSRITQFYAGLVLTRPEPRIGAARPVTSFTVSDNLCNLPIRLPEQAVPVR